MLEKKPEEKVWFNVAQSNLKSPKNISAYRLKKNDLFKLGRVRFKVREIVSPFYN